MNKVLHALVYVFLALAGAALFFETSLNAKRAELTDRNRMQEDYIVRIARTVESASPDKGAAFEIKMDRGPVEARVEAPEEENILEEYPAYLEQANLETFNWDGTDARRQLRTVYVLDAEGKPVMDGNEPLKRGKGTEDELLSRLFDAAKAQQGRLNTTRSALSELRGKLETVATELNGVKKTARNALVENEQNKQALAASEKARDDLENDIKKLRSQIDELNAENASLKDEVNTAKDETSAAKEETEKAKQIIENLKNMLKDSIPTQKAAARGGVPVASLPVGDKGTLVDVDNENMFAIVKFSDDTMKQLKGEALDRPMAALELGVRRPGFNGEAGEFVGKIKIRQEVQGRNYAVCDILGAWEQSKLAVGDTVFAD